MPAEKPAKGERRHVAQLRRENDVEEIAVSIHRVREETEVSEHPADVNKADDAQRHALQLAAGAVAQDRHEQNERDGEDGHCHEKAIPARAGLLSARMRHERRRTHG
jgi:hypothetical protein